jgi:4-hydroxybenzoate polyprenyltransferase
MKQTFLTTLWIGLVYTLGLIQGIIASGSKNIAFTSVFSIILFTTTIFIAFCVIELYEEKTKKIEQEKIVKRGKKK